MTDMTRVMVVDDVLDMRVLLTLLLERGSAARVVAQAEDAAHALSVLAALPTGALPHVMIVDFRLPDMSGLDLAEKILAVHRDVSIVLYSAYLDQETRDRAERIGVRACVSKNMFPTLPGLVQALRGPANLTPDPANLIPEQGQSPDRVTASSTGLPLNDRGLPRQ